MNIFWVVFFCLFSTSMAWGEGTLTLSEAYLQALRQSETVAVSEQAIRIAEAHYLQGLGTALPHINFEATESVQDTGGSGAGGGVGTTLTRRSRPELAFSLRQPLFQGFREFRTLGIAGAEKKRNLYRFERAKQLLFADVARAHYMVIELEKEIRILESIRDTYARRNREIRERIQLGKSREGENYSGESQLAVLNADVDVTRGRVIAARDLLAFLVGRPVQEKLVDAFAVPGRIEQLNELIAKLSSRPDLKASLEDIRLSQGRLQYEKGGRLPTVNFESNYYPYRVGFQSDINWDMLFTLNVPIFQGGAVRGRIQEADALLRQTSLSHQENVRRAELDLRQSYASLNASRSREASLRRAAQAAESAFRSLSEEYRFGLLNNLEVLQSLRDWQETRRAANLAHYQTKLDYLQLRVATGDMELPDHKSGGDTALPPNPPSEPPLSDRSLRRSVRHKADTVRARSLGEAKP